MKLHNSFVRNLVKFIILNFFTDYSFEREHVGLRRLAGYGVTVTRGAASGMMWTYSCLLITMSRNIITFLRETFLHRFIPFDSFIPMHKFIAALALFFTGFFYLILYKCCRKIFINISINGQKADLHNI